MKDVRPKLLPAGPSFEPTISPIAILFGRQTRNSAALEQKDNLLPRKRDRRRDTINYIDVLPHGSTAKPHANHAVVPKQRYRVRWLFILIIATARSTGLRPSVPVEPFVMCPSARPKYRLRNGRYLFIHICVIFFIISI